GAATLVRPRMTYGVCAGSSRRAWLPCESWRLVRPRVLHAQRAVLPGVPARRALPAVPVPTLERVPGALAAAPAGRRRAGDHRPVVRRRAGGARRTTAVA